MNAPSQAATRQADFINYVARMPGFLQFFKPFSDLLPANPAASMKRFIAL